MTTITAINIGGDTRTQEDKIGLRIRKRMIDSGQVVPTTRNPGFRPYMHPDAVARTRIRLIKEGILIPDSYESGIPSEVLIASRPYRRCHTCRANHWLCSCGVFE